MLLNKKLPTNYILKMARKHFILVSVISVTVYFLQQQLIDLLPSIPVSIPIFLGTAISLILSFNLNQSYERWWEARKIWGAIVNDSRSLIIQVKTFSERQDKDMIRRIAYRQIAWCYAFGQSLRETDPLENVADFVSTNEYISFLSHSNVPLAIIDEHAKDIKQWKDKGQINAFYHVQLDETLVRLVDSMGKAERIKKTVYPTTYSFFLHSLIYIFIFLLSISLSEIDGMFEIPLLIIISVPFLLLERTAKDMQDPFSGNETDTPVTAIARGIEVNLKQMIGETKLVEALPANDFYMD